DAARVESQSRAAAARPGVPLRKAPPGKAAVDPKEPGPAWAPCLPVLARVSLPARWGGQERKPPLAPPDAFRAWLVPRGRVLWPAAVASPALALLATPPRALLATPPRALLATQPPASLATPPASLATPPASLATPPASLATPPAACLPPPARALVAAPPAALPVWGPPLLQSVGGSACLPKADGWAPRAPDV